MRGLVFSVEKMRKGRLEDEFLLGTSSAENTLSGANIGATGAKIGATGGN